MVDIFLCSKFSRYQKPCYPQLSLQGICFFWMSTLEVQQEFISILVQFVKYANLSIIALRSSRVVLYVTVSGKHGIQW